MANLERAIEIAVLTHKGASDKSGAPYILHPLRLMFGIEDIEVKIVAVLHDVVEDGKPPCRWGLQELKAEGFSANVIEAIDCVTKRPRRRAPGGTRSLVSRTASVHVSTTLAANSVRTKKRGHPQLGVTVSAPANAGHYL
jgi:(p)ppGpp synthase/HD superfamily hydrolase